MNKRTIAIFTGNRAEYGLQYPILKAVSEDDSLEYKLLVSGAHLDSNFGATLDEIKKDGFEITEEIKIDLSVDSNISTAMAISSGVSEISRCLAEIKPDLFVVYADRFEGFAAVIASTQMAIPTAHIEGGDLTEGGALDDSVRHAMTKLSHIHFTTNEDATKRILNMGEESWRVHTVGFPAIDLIDNDNFASADEIVSRYNLDLSYPVVLFTQHSITTEFNLSAEQVRPSLDALKELSLNGTQIIITYPNNDAGGQAIISEIENIDLDKFPNINVTKSLGRYNYHGILALARNQKNKIVCAGNSSSGIKETPVFGCPTLNIGSRQDARLRANNVIDVEYSKLGIIKSLKKCFEDKNFRKICFDCENPYFLGGAGKKISSVLKKIEINERLIRKKMTY